MNYVGTCPLCQSGSASSHSAPNPNLYSEMLADLTGTCEEDLLERVANVQCSDCGLIYKQQWFPQEQLIRLFRERVPSHPKGWDVLSGRFSPENFQAEVSAYESALARNDRGQTARYRRALSSIIDSIPELNGTPEQNQLLSAIQQGDIATLRAANDLLRRTMSEPTPYKRFSGFSANSLWNYLEGRIGPIERYAEVGCPLWGLIPRAIEHGKIATWLDRPEPNYWSNGCHKQGTHCTDYLINTTGAHRASWSDTLEAKHDAIGAFQYLDHLEQPGQFMTELFERANTAAIILDAVDQPVYIQHLTGWTTKAMQWLADKHECRLHDDFEEIRSSGNALYLLQKS